MKLAPFLSASLWCLVHSAPRLAAADYNVDSQAAFDALNATDFEPGDRILFEGGMTFTGNLYFSSEDLGTDVDPIVLTSVGTGLATIEAGDSYGINCYNTGGFEVSNLSIFGSGVEEGGSTTNTSGGIIFYADAAGNVKYPRVHLDQIEVTGFGRRGVLVAGFNGSTGYSDVRITSVVSHGNLRSGIETFGDTGVTNALTNVYIADCESYHNVGTASLSANGIILGGVDGGVVERCVVYDNGKNNGSFGIRAYDSNDITLQHNEVHSQKTPGIGGATGFALDLAVTNSVMQYNYSHDNEGAGYLVFSDANLRRDVPENTGNTVRFNISENDGRNAGHAAASGIQVGGRVNASSVYGNTIFMDGPGSNTTSPAIAVYGASFHDPDDLLLANNLFVTADNSRVVRFVSFFGGVTTFAGNNYWASGGTLTIDYEGTTYNTLAAWRAASGQEMVGGGDSGFSVDPLLVDPGNGGTVSDPALLPSLTAYKLQGASPMIDQGLDLLTLFSINIGPQDFHGSTLPQGAGVDVGASEYAAPSTPPVVLDLHYSDATNTVTIDYQSESGVDFGVRRSSDLAGDPATTWTVLASTGPGDGNVKQYTDNPPPGTSFFYVLVRE